MKNFQQFQEATRLKNEMGYDKGVTKKPTSDSKDSVLDAVKKSIRDKYGKGAIMRSGSNQSKKVKGQKSTAGTGKYKKMSDDRKQLKKDAKEMGYGSKENMKSGKGLGT